MKKFAAFDIDGTLIRWQLYHAITNELAKQGHLPTNVIDTIKDARIRWKRRESDSSFHEYEHILIDSFESSLRRIKHKVVDEAIYRVVQEYREQTYVYTRDLAKKLKKEGYVLIAISGSHDEIVDHIAKHYNFDYWIGSKYERTAEGFSGKSVIASINKKQILQDMIKYYGLSTIDSYAVGDTANDAAMLELVENPIAFNPNRTLFEIATSRGWKIVIERKNVCYELVCINGQYLLLN